MLILINNKLVSKKNAKVSILSDIGRGYGVFETLRTYNEKLFQPNEHIDRLLNSAKKIDLKIKYKKLQIKKMLEKIAKKSNTKNQRIKIMAITNQIIIISTPLKEDKKIYEGVKALAMECIRSLPEIKSISYLPSFLCHERANKKGYFEAILTQKNEVYEGAYSNIFWFEGNTLCTREKDILPGITRDTILEISPFKTKFKKINIEKLKKQKEVFLTTSVKGIVPIIQIDKTVVGNGKPGKNTEVLMKEFNNFASSTCF